MKPLVPHKTPKKGPGKKVILHVLGLFFVLAVYLVYSALNRPRNETKTMDAFAQLDLVLRREGLARFKQEKFALKHLVKRTLKEAKTQEEQEQAQTIAVYLFPEVLSNDDYEKEVAQAFWEPLQQAIEHEPGTAKSRLMFNELRANIWNYENADRVNPQLSNSAKQVIRIYETLSAP